MGRGPRRVLAVLAALLAAAQTAASGDAHVEAKPASLASGGSSCVDFVGANERDTSMTAFSITVPPGLEIECGTMDPRAGIPLDLQERLFPPTLQEK